MSYYDKYIKYKSKYIHEINKMKGGVYEIFDKKLVDTTLDELKTLYETFIKKINENNKDKLNDITPILEKISFLQSILYRMKYNSDNNPKVYKDNIDKITEINKKILKYNINYNNIHNIKFENICPIYSDALLYRIDKNNKFFDINLSSYKSTLEPFIIANNTLDETITEYNENIKNIHSRFINIFLDFITVFTNIECSNDETTKETIHTLPEYNDAITKIINAGLVNNKPPEQNIPNKVPNTNHLKQSPKTNPKSKPKTTPNQSPKQPPSKAQNQSTCNHPPSKTK